MDERQREGVQLGDDMSRPEIVSKKKTACPNCSKTDDDKRICTVTFENHTNMFEDDNDDDRYEPYTVYIDILLKCDGCGYPFFKRIHVFSEYDEPVETYTFPATSGYGVRDDIDITQDLNECDDIVRIYKETLSAIRSKLFTLAAMGTRTLLDRAIVKITNDDAENFTGNINKAVSKNLISKVDQDLLMPILDIGGRAAHICHTPSGEDVNLWFGIVTTMIKHHMVTAERAKVAKATIPPRK
ncbi:DUF4145 domain-containing protein [Nitratidesulfovibrio liaohensis]|uniref:DUF4145 domain-containing protein n=1 Tax=Nitratidesulfovibrio liaohensis TaxID=2604158 RepID=UPI00141DDF1A|nr:DUF4145 domain-containing protein [Nitratidesulfovibrio liaohensis]NHZ46309.1 DUF4145 domain-containing protein [Nitratidesulfovibrio liaohensis]